MLSFEAGFEHRKRRYETIVVTGDKLSSEWRSEEPQGPASSTVIVQRNEDGSDEIVYVSSLEGSLEGMVDEATVLRLKWDANKRDFVEVAKTCDGRVMFVVLATFASLEKALEAKQKVCRPTGQGASAGLPSPLVLQAPSGASRQGFLLGYLSTDKPAARRLALSSSKCWPPVRSSVLSWCW